MPIAIYVLFGALFTAVTAIALGRLVLRRVTSGLTDQEELPLAFVTGSAILSLIVFLLCSAHLAYKGVFLAVGLVTIAAAVRFGAHKRLASRFEPLTREQKLVFLAGFGFFTIFYFLNAMAPECSPDGASYHLSFVARYMREHSFVRLPYNLYAQLSQGIEMLFTFAFAFGRHSAAALVHFWFLVSMALLILSFGRRIGHPAVGVAASLFVYASPVAGIDGTSAYVDIAVACIIFSVFYLLEVWDENRSTGLLVVVGLLAGFCYAAKYTAFLAAPYAVLFVLWRTRRLRPALITAACSVILVVPWVAKDLLYTGNPVSPFSNTLFPNWFVNPRFEHEWTQMLRLYSITSRWQIPWQITMRGEKLPGIIGPVFLLLPLALLSLRDKIGRRLVLAGVLFTIPFFANIAARFFLPALPFWALALAMALASWPRMLTALAALVCILDWPGVASRYASPYLWMLEPKFPAAAALRIESEDHWLGRKHPDYVITRVIEAKTPRGARIYTMNAIAEAYTTREVAVSFQSTRGESLRDTFYAAFAKDYQPTLRQSLKFPARAIRKFRIVSTDPPTPTREWMVNELRLFAHGQEISREPGWRLGAYPNPWESPLAFDNSPVTRWRAWQPVAPGAFIEVDLGSSKEMDEVALDTHYGETGLHFRLDVEEGGQWKDAGAKLTEGELPPAGFLGKASMAEFKARGFDYILLDIDQWGGQEVAEDPREWGLSEAGRAGKKVLFHIDLPGPELLTR